MIYENVNGVPKFEVSEFAAKKTKFCLCIPIINEGERIRKQLIEAQNYKIDQLIDIIICDGGSTDGVTSQEVLEPLGVNTMLVKTDIGKQGAQLRMGLWWALQRGYEGVITIDGNNKDSIESVPLFVEKLKQGYDFIQGSRFIKGGEATNTPVIRYLAVKLLHAPIISLAAGARFTDTTNAFRGYSRRYLEHPDVQPFRSIFMTYELLAYLSVRASQLGLKVLEVPVRRAYPPKGKTPTKISFFKGNGGLLKILIKTLFRSYHPQ